mmetsp:Transcript_4438/g.5116  ORF Transcript_4438/g.5116 Transcript_4438/m.5116 type:complete len:268 (+) Transcript_4438:128-931(+)
MACSKSTEAVLIFVGDSDISRWPSNHLPTVAEKNHLKHHKIKETALNHAVSGSLLHDLPDQIAAALDEYHLIKKNKHHHEHIFFIACAGENDLSNGQPIDTILQSFHNVITNVFNESKCETKPHLIFFGPKLEPCVIDDESVRKSYFQLSERFSAACQELKVQVTQDHNDHHRHEESTHHCHSDGKNISYIDCLTMFCGHSSGVKGAILNGEVKPEALYFDRDGLHLNEAGYRVWKDQVENLLSTILCTERCEDSLDMSHTKNCLSD